MNVNTMTTLLFQRDREIADVKDRYSKDHENSGLLKMQMAGLEEQKKFQQFIKEEERKESDQISESIRQETIRGTNLVIMTHDTYGKLTNRLQQHKYSH